MATLRELSNLKGRQALITGAAGGLGQIFAETLAELGADLILVDLHGTNLEDLADRLIKGWGISVKNIYCDLENQNQRSALIKQVTNSKGDLNILVNNAALVGASDLEGWSVPFEDQSIDTWRRATEINLTAVFDLCQGLLPLMKNAMGANIVNIASIYGSYGPDWSLYKDTEMGNPAAYAATKGGLIQFTRWLATTISPAVRVNAISPGGVLRNQPKSFQNRYESKVPMARMASEQDFKGALAFLSTDLSAYVTGHILEVNGGWGAW
jgi:NAD(P)-dependent dehydrogenase (short-subunit alcohol dehydrogenase family)